MWKLTGLVDSLRVTNMWRNGLHSLSLGGQYCRQEVRESMRQERTFVCLF